MGVEFEFTIEIRDIKDKRGFRKGINDLRSRLSLRFFRSRPALVVQQNPPTRFFNLVIRIDNLSLRFRLRMDNLYLIGYQMENGQWLEFDNDNVADLHLIAEPGTRFLGFNGSYRGLATAADRRVEEIGVGYFPLRSAISELATSTQREIRARSLIVIIMMICEATRFIPVSTYMFENFNAQQSPRIPSWILSLIRSWEDFSAVLMRADDIPTDPPVSFMIPPNDIQIPPPYGPAQILNQADIIAILGILVGLCLDPKGRTKFPPMTFDEEPCLTGLTLVEVFSVHIEASNLGQKIYGTVTIHNGIAVQNIYNYTSNNPESIKPTHNVSLTGPSRPITAFGDVDIELLLTERHIHDELSRSWDTEIIHDAISWNAFDIGKVYDKLISKKLDSSRGSVTVNYAVLRDAVGARVTVTLEEGGETTTNVYGQVSAHYDKWEDPQTKCLLFDRTSDDYVDVRRRANIPLLRSVVAVPLNSSLKVTASLWDYDTFSADDKIATGTVEFPVPDTLPGTSSKEIRGEDGNWVTVTVSWTSDF